MEQKERDRFADDDDNMSVADHYSGSHFHESNEETMRSLEREYEKYRIEERFSEMNNQIG